MSDKFIGGIVVGSTDVTTSVLLRSTTDNTEVTGKAYTDVVGSYQRQGAARVAITMATQTVTGAHSDGGFVEIDATNTPGNYRFDIPDAAFASGADWVVITAKVAGCYVFYERFALERILSATATGNLEDMFDGTGYTNDSAPATQEQVGRLTSGTAAINTVAESFTKAGAEPETNTYESTFSLDGTLHIVEDDAGSTDGYYQADVGGNGVPVSITWQGYAQSQGDAYSIWAYNYGTTTYEQIGSVAGLAGTTIRTETFDLTNAHVGSGANIGKVRFRFYSTDGTAFATDRLLFSYAVVAQSVGYALGAIWLNTRKSNTNTVVHVDGIADNPVSTWAAILALNAILSLDTFYIANGSDFALNTDSSNFTLLGCNYTLALGGQILENTHIEEALVSGIATAGSGEIHFKSCHMGDCTLGKSHTCCSALEGTITLSAAETYIFNSCYASDGAEPPEIDFNDVAATVRLSGWDGGIKVKNMAAGSKITIQGMGKLTIDSTCDAGGTIGLSGNMTRQDDVDGGFSGTINEDARIDVGQIKAECDTALTDYDPPTNTEMLAAHTTTDALVDEVETILKSAVYGLAAIETLVDEIETLLKNATYGLSALRTQGDAAWATATGFSTHDAAAVKAAIEAAGSHLALIMAQTDLVTAARMGALTDWIDGGRLDLLLDAITTTVNFLKDIDGGRWKIDTVNNQMIFYKSDNSTEVARFDLKNAAGAPASTNVHDRQRV